MASPAAITCPITGLSISQFALDLAAHPQIQAFAAPHPLLSLPPKRALSILLSIDNPPAGIALPLIVNSLTITNRVEFAGSIAKGASSLGQGNIAELRALAERLSLAPPMAIAALPRVIVRDYPTLIGLPTVFNAAFNDYQSGTDRRLTAINLHSETRALDALAMRLNAREARIRETIPSRIARKILLDSAMPAHSLDYFVGVLSSTKPVPLVDLDELHEWLSQWQTDSLIRHAVINNVILPRIAKAKATDVFTILGFTSAERATFSIAPRLPELRATYAPTQQAIITPKLLDETISKLQAIRAKLNEGKSS